MIHTEYVSNSVLFSDLSSTFPSSILFAFNVPRVGQYQLIYVGREDVVSQNMKVRECVFWLTFIRLP